MDLRQPRAVHCDPSLARMLKNTTARACQYFSQVYLPLHDMQNLITPSASRNSPTPAAGYCSKGNRAMQISWPPTAGLCPLETNQSSLYFVSPGLGWVIIKSGYFLHNFWHVPGLSNSILAKFLVPNMCNCKFKIQLHYLAARFLVSILVSAIKNENDTVWTCHIQ